MPNTMPEASVAKLTQVHDVHFFAKLAAMPNPIKPRTDAEREQLLKVAAHVRAKHDEELQKQASTGNQFLNGLLEALTGQPAQVGSVSYENAVKQAAAHWSQDPEIAQAALEYNDWLLAGGN